MDYTDNFNTDLLKAMKKLEEVRKGKNDRKGEVLLSESRERRYHRGHKGEMICRIRCSSRALALLTSMVKNKKQFKNVFACLWHRVSCFEVPMLLKGHSFNQEGHNNTAVLLISQCLVHPYQGWQTALAATHLAPGQTGGISF